MTFDLQPLRRRWLAIWACTFAVMVASLALGAGALHAALSPDERVLAARLVAATGDLPYLIVAALLALAALLATWITRVYFQPLSRAAEQARLIGAANPDARLDATGPRELRALALAVNALAEALQRLTGNEAARIAEALADVELERHRLAALMSELTQGVVVCNADGRILLYNESARRLLTAPDGAGSSGTGYMGIGRSLHALMSKESIEHALARLRARIAAGAVDPTATFATSIAGGAILRARIAPIASVTVNPGDTPAAGYVLLLEDLSRELSELEHRDTLLAGLVEQSRAALGSVRAATENLAGQPDMPIGPRLRFLEIAQEELQRLTHLVERTGRDHAPRMNRRPDLEPIRVAELSEAIAGQVRSIRGVAVELKPIDPSVWVQVDSYALMQAVRYLARRLRQRQESLALTLAATPAGDYVYFDIAWCGDKVAAATVLEWETAPLSVAGEPSDITLRELIIRNRAEFWHDSQSAAAQPFFRILLRRVAAESVQHTSRHGRPVYYDFDLFHRPDPGRALDEAPLTSLSYTAFDTETTGLEPSAGDEIISIGAVRIVNGRVLQGETFDQLIDPKRPIDPESAKIHGIRREMLAGQPGIGMVLPAFHRFCEDTVLVGHNAAFDLRFLQVKEASTGLRFAHPVLDTLLLSALLHEALADHRLEAIAQRMGVDVIARHTALGDALLTARVFLRMLPLLAAQGIVTLRQAREASERTYYAKLRY